MAARFKQVASYVRRLVTSSDSKEVPERQVPPPTLLLIGSTGNGKSTLGNFLIDPADRHIFDEQIFRTARDSRPETQSVKIGLLDSTDGKPLIRVIDTPGLNESAAKDLKHMIDIVRTLNDLDSISACILCVKFESKIDAQYKATVAYYKKLLPRLFEGNVVIVLTAFQTDRRSEMERKRRQVNIDAVVSNAQKAVREIGDLSYDPQVFKMDCMPMDDSEREESERTRAAIFDFIQSTMKPTRICDLKVAKTDELKRRDAEQIKLVDGEISGYNTRLKEANSKAKKVLSKIEKGEKRISEVDNIIHSLDAVLQEKDSPDTVTAVEWSLNQEWAFFSWQTKSFEVTSPWPVLEHSRWDNGHLSWDEFDVTRDPGGATGKVTGDFFRGLYANVTLKTSKDIKYREEIRALRQQISMQQIHLQDLKKDREEYFDEQNEYSEEIRLLKEYISQRVETKKELSRELIPVGEALNRLEELIEA